jgi:hypothetical protein
MAKNGLIGNVVRKGKNAVGSVTRGVGEFFKSVTPTMKKSRGGKCMRGGKSRKTRRSRGSRKSRKN